MREILKMVMVLSIICSVSGYFLGTIKIATKERIQEQVLTHVKGPALKGLFPRYDNNPVADYRKIMVKGHEYTVFPFYLDKKLIGTAFESFGPGFSGDIGVMVGFSFGEDRLGGIGITTMTETPGLGSRIADPGFIDQFTGHAFENIGLNSKGGDIDGVSGATYSSLGAVTAVAGAVNIYPEIRKKMVKEQ